MSPEQVRSSKTVGPQTDIWSLALVLYELVSKRHPFQGDSPASIVAAIAADQPHPLAAAVGPNLWSVIEPALRKDPMQRPQTIAAFAQSLAPFGGDRGRIVLTRIERLASSNATSSQATRAMISGPPAPPVDTAVSPQRSQPPLRSAVPDLPPPASARTTYGPGAAASKKMPTLGLVLGGLAIVGVGAALGMRSQGSHRAVAPPPSVSVGVWSAVTSEVASGITPVASVLPLSSWTPAPVTPASAPGPAGKTRKPGSKPIASAAPNGPSAPRQGDFN